jgi:hypothetical protein
MRSGWSTTKLPVSRSACLRTSSSIRAPTADRALALSPQCANSGKVAALVGEKAQHRNRVDALHNLFVGERRSGIRHCVTNALTP